MFVVIVMGLSGAGKTLALHILEDESFFCIDNLPSNLLSELMDSLGNNSTLESGKIAFGLDSRTPGLEYTQNQVDQLREKGHDVKIVFLTARDEVLINRYGETRRTHPLSREGFVPEAIRRERALMEPYKEAADYVLDTSNLRPSQLSEALRSILLEGKGREIVLQIRSFGYKHGVPMDADWVVDVRFLPNPYWLKELRPLSGRAETVQEYIDQDAGVEPFLEKLSDLLFPLLTEYEKAGKPRLMLCIGCTGGQHRSVYIAERLAKMASDQGKRMLLQHRDMTEA